MHLIKTSTFEMRAIRMLETNYTIMIKHCLYDMYNTIHWTFI